MADSESFLAELVKKKESTDPLIHLSAKFLSGALGGIPEAAARRIGAEGPFEAEGGLGVAGHAADLAGFVAGIPGKALSAVSHGVKATSVAGRAVESGLRQGGFGAVYAGLRSAAGGEDVVQNVLEEAPLWAAFGVGGEVIGPLLKRMRPRRMAQSTEISMGFSDDVPLLEYKPQARLEYKPKKGRTIRLGGTVPKSPDISLTQRYLATKGSRFSGSAPIKVIKKEAVELFDSFGRKVEKPGFMLSAQELLAKRRVKEPVAILYNKDGVAVGATSYKEVVYEKPDFKGRSKAIQAKLVKSRTKEMETFRARLFPRKSIHSKLNRAKILGDRTETSATAGKIRQMREDSSIIQAAKLGGRLPNSFGMTSLEANTLYDITILSRQENPISLTVTGNTLRKMLKGTNTKFIDVKPKWEGAGFMSGEHFENAYINL